MGSFYLKYRDTYPILEVTLLDATNTAHDLTGITSVNLHIRLADGTVVTKAMTVTSESGGVVHYDWLAADWVNVPALNVGTHQMEYEVLGPGNVRLTFPNNSYDLLVITSDIGQS